MFKIGDKVQSISDSYNITKKGWVGIVTNMEERGVIWLKGVTSHQETSNITAWAKDFVLDTPKPRRNLPDWW